jgi:hypothetical protein
MSFARMRCRRQPPGRSRIDSNFCRKHLSVLVFERCYWGVGLAGELRLNPAGAIRPATISAIPERLNGGRFSRDASAISLRYSKPRN